MLHDRYVGSATCQGCHSNAHASWSETWMARTVRKPTEKELQTIENSILCGGMQVDFVLGGRINLRFLQKRDGHYVFLPCEYEAATKQVKPFRLNDWQTFSFDEKCAACHTTNFDSATNTWLEEGVGCESCHGPGSRHGDFSAPNGMIRFSKITPVEEGMICSSCHLQGGYSLHSDRRFPEKYKPGDDLFRHYRFPWETLSGVTSPTDPIDVHQKVLMKLELDGKSDLRCTSCHDVHQGSNEKHQKLPKQEFCLQCHKEENGAFLLRDYQVQCPVCEF
jgi:predicted CXXCH cytochrome family protein